MLAGTTFGAIAVFIGTLLGHHDVAAITLTLVWAFAAGMLVAVDTAAADIGLISLVTLVVFSARPMSLHEAAVSGLLAFAGGLCKHRWH